MRDLLVWPRRYSDLLAGLPGIPTNVLGRRLKELEEDGLVVREARTGSGHGGTPSRRRPVTYEVGVGSAVAHATVARGEISAGPGPDPAPDLVLNAGPGFRDVLAGVLNPDAALATGAVELIGDESMFADFVATFTVPYSAALSP